MLEIISGASRHLDPATRDRHPEIPWRAIRDSGNFYRHDYDNVAASYVWTSVVERLPAMMAVVLAEIERSAPGPEPDGASRPRPPPYALLT